MNLDTVIVLAVLWLLLLAVATFERIVVIVGSAIFIGLIVFFLLI